MRIQLTGLSGKEEAKGSYNSWLKFSSHSTVLLGPPVERLEYGYPFFFSAVYVSRGTLPKKVGKGALLGT